MEHSFNFLGMQTDFGIHWWSLLLSFLPLAIRLVMDDYKIEFKKKEINHTSSTVVTCLISVVCSVIIYLGEPIHWFQAPALMIGIFVLLFDYILNLLRGEKCSYVDQGLDGKSSYWDKLRNYLPWWGEVFTKLWIALVLFSVYFYWSLIIGIRTAW